MTEITRVYVDMVADLFHYGHVNFLRQAKSHGDFLLVGVHSDETVESYKRSPILSMDERVASVAGCRYVDEVVPNAPLKITRDWIEKHNIDLIMHGDDVAPEVEDVWYGPTRRPDARLGEIDAALGAPRHRPERGAHVVAALAAGGEASR